VVVADRARCRFHDREAFCPGKRGKTLRDHGRPRSAGHNGDRIARQVGT
jgi:hypothetical protein